MLSTYMYNKYRAFHMLNLVNILQKQEKMLLEFLPKVFNVSRDMKISIQQKTMVVKVLMRASLVYFVDIKPECKFHSDEHA